MKIYLATEFTSDMLAKGWLAYDVSKTGVKEVQDHAEDAISLVRRPEVARAFEIVLGFPVKTGEPVFETITKDDTVYYGRYVGTQPTVDAVKLPEGASIEWCVVEITG